MLVLIVDDEKHIRELLAIYLQQAGFQVSEAIHGADALYKLKECNPTIIILDLMMPVLNGMETCKQIRQQSTVPIIMLTSRTQEHDRILGLDMGADDYVAKPFNPLEVVARVKAVLRRTQVPQPLIQQAISIPELDIDLEKREVTAFGLTVTLTNKELDVLWQLAIHQGKVLSREQLLQLVWDYSYDGDTRTVDTHVKRLRKKLGSGSATLWDIKTIWGIGYKFEVRE